MTRDHTVSACYDAGMTKKKERVTRRLLQCGFEALEPQRKAVAVGMIFNAIRQMNDFSM